jgi:hypothetical protein
MTSEVVGSLKHRPTIFSHHPLLRVRLSDCDLRLLLHLHTHNTLAGVEGGCSLVDGPSPLDSFDV